MSFVGATGYSENQEQFDILKDEIDANASYINNLVGIPDPLHTAIFGINILNPGLFGLVERAEVKIGLLETGEETLGTDITGLTTQVEGIQTEVAGIQTEITGIQTEITGLEGSISTIQFVELPLLATGIGLADAIAVDARNKANRALGIWDESGDNVYHKKSGNVGIGTTFGSVLTNKLEVNGNINIPTGSTFRIGNEPFNYTHLAGTQPVSSKWTNATDVATNIYYNTGNVGIGTISGINNKLEIGGNLNISAGSKYKINNVNLAFSDLGGTLSYNSLSDKPTLFDGNYNSLTNKLTQGTNISIVGSVINNTYTLPTATTAVIGGVRVDNSTIFINGSGVISSAAGTAQVNSDWTQINTSLKSFILNKPTAGTNISFAGNTITNTIIGSPTQNIIDLNTNHLIIKDKPDSQIVTNVDVPLTTLNEPTINPSVIATDVYYPRVPSNNSLTWSDNGKTIVVKVSDAELYVGGSVYFLFNHIITSQDHYHSLQTYTGTGNTYIGTTRFKTFAGIAISVDYGRSIYPERMRIAPRPLQSGFYGSTFINGAPKAFKIFASDDASCWNDNNHSSWTQIHDQTTGLTYTNEQYTIVNLTSNLPKYRYYTMVVLSTIGSYSGGYMIFSEWNIGGDEKIDPIPEGNPITHKTLNFAYSTTPPNTYTLSVQPGTSIQVNNGTAQYLSGNYTITVGATQSSVVVAGIGQVGTDPYPLTNGSTIAIRYSMLQRIISTINMKKDGLIKYVPASGTNPTTGTWQIVDIDSQLLSQFAGNLSMSKITPTDELQIVGVGNATLKIRSTDLNGSGNPRIEFLRGSDTFGSDLSDWRIESIYGTGELQFVRQSQFSNNLITFNGSGKIGVGVSSVQALIHLRNQYPEEVALKLDVNGTASLTIQAFTIGTTDVGWKFVTTNGIIANQPLSFTHDGNIYFQQGKWHYCSNGNERLAFNANSTTFIRGHGATPISFRNSTDVELLTINSGGGVIGNNYILARGGGNDTWIYSETGSMTLNMGLQNTQGEPSFMRLGAYAGHTYLESNQNRSIRLVCNSDIFSGTLRQWEFNINAQSHNPINSANWTVVSDQRIKENIVKADLKTCYDNVKNINLYRYNLIDSFQTASQDKNKLGYIAQEIHRHFPKATIRSKTRLSDKREIPDLLSIDVEQIHLTLYGAVKQLIKIVEKQNKRIKTLETLLNIEDDDNVENDAGKAYEKIYDEEEVDIDDIEPTEPEQEGVSPPYDEGVKAPVSEVIPSDEGVVINEEEVDEEINVD